MRPRGPRAILPHAVTIFPSACLPVLGQPIIAKQIPPWFGGSAAVWTTCPVLFQSVLLAGDSSACATTTLGIVGQTRCHPVLLAIWLATLPILASGAGKPQGDEAPIVCILPLAATIGLPCCLRSTTTPPQQAWH